MDDAALRAVEPLEQALLVVLVHQEADGAAVHAVDRRAVPMKRCRLCSMRPSPPSATTTFASSGVATGSSTRRPRASSASGAPEERKASIRAGLADGSSASAGASRTQRPRSFCPPLEGKAPCRTLPAEPRSYKWQASLFRRSSLVKESRAVARGNGQMAEALKQTPLQPRRILSLAPAWGPCSATTCRFNIQRACSRASAHARERRPLRRLAHGPALAQRKIRELRRSRRGVEALIPVDLLGLSAGRQRYGFLTCENGGVFDDLMISR